ncbi:hypothetical protein BBP40_000566 [Aspergillus hancockii]|nr:hypothetical protein BBP40_000566 [Aspergillus hancockii]
MTRTTDPSWEHYHVDGPAYKTSKEAMNMVAGDYAKKLKDAGELVNAACPSLVQTKLNGFASGGMTPDLGARRIVQLALLDKDGPTASFRIGTILFPGEVY